MKTDDYSEYTLYRIATADASLLGHVFSRRDYILLLCLDGITAIAVISISSWRTSQIEFLRQTEQHYIGWMQLPARIN